MSTILQQLQETKAYIQSKVKENAAIGIILGSGLGNLASEIVTEFEIPYEEIPHFPVSTVEGHKGRLIFGTLEGNVRPFSFL
jgi:purine-nucleoside phosphorylase